MTAEIICVGTELLLGNIVNTNAAYLAEKLAGAGLDCYYQTVVGDNVERLAGVLKCAMERSDVILLSGGLGPTEDDLTKETVAEVCGKNLSVDDHSMERIAEFFAVRDIQPTENNWKQAMVPEGAKVLDNDNGTAPGIILETEKNRIVLLPGPPAELVPMFEQQVLPYLDRLTPGVICSQMVKLCGVPESQVEDTLKDLIDGQTNPTIATYAKTGEVTLRLSTKAKDQASADAKLDVLEKEILSRHTLDHQPLHDLFYGYGDDNSMAKVAFDLLKQTGKTITAAESLTAGLFQATLADFSGASSIFAGGFVTYSLEEKSKMLSIPAQELEQHGVVSHFTAQAMASQARKLTGSDYGVRLTGVAGPDSLEGHPAGTVFIGLATPNGVDSVQVNIAGRSRADVREIAVLHAFNLVRLAVLNGENLV